MSTALVDGLRLEHLPGRRPEGAPESAYRARVAAAALSCLSRFGLAKTTVDDIARQAGLSRATLYRAFPGGREEILATTVRTELDRYLATLAAAIEAADGLEELLVAALTTAADGLARHEALGFLLAHEPEVVVPYLSFAGSDRVLAAAGDFLAPYLDPYLPAPHARRVGQWLARLVLSYVACPHPGASGEGSEAAARGRRKRQEARFGLHPEPIGTERARHLVAAFVLPGIEELKRSTKEKTT